MRKLIRAYPRKNFYKIEIIDQYEVPNIKAHFKKLKQGSNSD